MKKILIITIAVLGIILSIPILNIYGKNNPQNSSLAGDDLNNNGIRDDVETYINIKFGYSKKLEKGLNQFALTVQKGILSTNEQDSWIAANSFSRAMECLSYLSPDEDYWRNVLEQSVNTPKRVKAWMTHQARLSGKVFTSRPIREWKTSCTFNLDKLSD